MIERNSKNKRIFERVTDEEARNGVLEIDQTGHVVDAVFFGLLRIVDFHEDDSLLVALVVDVFHFVEHQSTGFFVLVVWSSSKYRLNFVTLDWN